MKSKSLTIRCLTLILTLCGISTTFADTTVRYTPGELLVKVQLNVDLTANNGRVTSSNPGLQAVLDEIQAQDIRESFPGDHQGSLMSRYYTVTISPDVDVIGAVINLSKLECIQSAQPNYVYTSHATPTDISYPEQWGLLKINAANAWDLFTGNSTIVIAVLDTGVDLNHQDLKNNLWVNSGEIPGNGIDDDNNGYVDDVNGWDFVSYMEYEYIFPEDSDTPIRYGTWIPEDNNPGNDPNDPIHPHGTHVSGIIGGVGNNTVAGNTNIVGTMWNCTVLPVRGLDYSGGGQSDWIAKGIRYATDNGARIINMSLGGSASSSIMDLAVQYAYKKGVVICASAGNSNTIRPSYPAAYENVISVAATDENDQRSIWPEYGPDIASNYGTTVDISAPGTDILSTVLNNEYEEYDGTSMACPFVSGVAGMILGYGDTIGKKFTPGQVEYIIEQSSDNITAQNPGFESWLGAGRLNLANAMTLAQNVHPMVSSIEIRSVAAPNEAPQVNEHSSINLEAIAIYSNGATENITSKVAWSLRPVRYGNFASYEAGKLIALQVPANREVVATATYTVNGDSFHGQQVVTILDDPNASPLSISGPDLIDPLSSASYRVVYTNADEQAVDVTAKASWEIISGTEYANFDTGQAGLLLTRISSAGKLLTIQATYVDETDRRAFMKSYNIQVETQSQQVAGLFLTAPAEVASGSTLALKATLIMAGQSQGQDVTAASAWSVSPTGAGSFIEPGLFLAGNVASETTITLTVEYTRNGQVYTAQLNTKVIPAVAMGDVVVDTDADMVVDLNTDTIFDSLNDLSLCPITGILTMMLLLGGLVMIRES